VNLYTNTEERPLLKRARPAFDCASISEGVCVCRCYTPATGLIKAVKTLIKFYAILCCSSFIKFNQSQKMLF